MVGTKTLISFFFCLLLNRPLCVTGHEGHGIDAFSRIFQEDHRTKLIPFWRKKGVGELLGPLIYVLYYGNAVKKILSGGYQPASKNAFGDETRSQHDPNGYNQSHPGDGQFDRRKLLNQPDEYLQDVDREADRNENQQPGNEIVLELVLDTGILHNRATYAFLETAAISVTGLFFASTKTNRGM